MLNVSAASVKVDVLIQKPDGAEAGWAAPVLSTLALPLDELSLALNLTVEARPEVESARPSNAHSSPRLTCCTFDGTQTPARIC